MESCRSRGASPGPAKRNRGESHMKTKLESRDKRRASIRKRVSGSAERPRLAVFRSLNHIYAQVINDDEGKTLVAFSTLNKELKSQLDGAKKKDQAKQVGMALAKACLAQG